tara:strand:- start:321 stop:758 length:438 start_codon:yes stop_codon:yes gene_type:complete
MFKLFEVRDGKLTALPDVSSKKIKSVIFSSIIVLIIVALSGWLKISEKELWKIYTLILQQFGLSHELPRTESEKELDARIELEVDKAIRDVIPEYDRIISDYDRKYKPIYIDEVNDETLCYTEECKSLAPPMRICAPWVSDCIKN